VTITSNLSLDKHDANVCATCFYWLRQLRRVRRSLDAESAATLVGHAFVTSRVDYCNAILAGASKSITDKLQRVINAAARVVMQRHAEVRSRTHRSTAQRAALAGRSRAGAVKAVLNGSPMSAAQGTTVHERLLQPHLAHCSSAVCCGLLAAVSCLCRDTVRRSMFRLSSRPDAFYGQFPSRPENFSFLVTFCVSRRRRKMYCGHAGLCVCLSVCLSAAVRPHYCTTQM